MQKERLRGFIEDDGSKSKLFGHCRVNTGKNAFFILREIKDSLIVRFFAYINICWEVRNLWVTCKVILYSVYCTVQCTYSVHMEHMGNNLRNEGWGQGGGERRNGSTYRK